MTRSTVILRKKPKQSVQTQELFATTARGMEGVLAGELTDLGLQVLAHDRGGVRFAGGLSECMLANLHLRTANRVLVPLAVFPCCDPDELYAGMLSIPWSEYLTPEMTLAVDCSLRDSGITHSRYAALKAKDAIVDQLRDEIGQRPSVDTAAPDVRVNLHILANQCTVSLDSSGDPLDRRGYRLDRTEAPLRETLAAAIIALTGWQGNTPFLDPLCGSGTLVIEAALKGAGIAPGLVRKGFGFQRWRNFDARLWQKLVAEAEAAIRPMLPFALSGSDQDEKAIAAAWQNARRAGVDRYVHFRQQLLVEVSPTEEKGIVIMNPPYGERLGNRQELVAFYRGIGDILKQRFTGYTAFVLTGDLELAKEVGLKASRRYVLFNGPIECRLLKYELY